MNATAVNRYLPPLAALALAAVGLSAWI